MVAGRVGSGDGVEGVVELGLEEGWLVGVGVGELGGLGPRRCCGTAQLGGWCIHKAGRQTWGIKHQKREFFHIPHLSYTPFL